MVFIDASLKPSKVVPVSCEMHLDSGLSVRYVAPEQYSKCLENGGSDKECSSFASDVLCNPRRKHSTVAGYCDETDKWEGVRDLCQALDDAVEIDHETSLFTDKRILEVGFCTGLPSALAYKYGAHSVTVHAWDAISLRDYVKPTMRKNNVPRNRSKFNSGDYESCKRLLNGQKFDIILAPEYISADETEFEQLHDLFDLALSPNGIIFFTARPFYEHCSGSLQAFTDLIKTKGTFDTFVRWTSTKVGEIAPRKMIQMTRQIR